MGDGNGCGAFGTTDRSHRLVDLFLACLDIPYGRHKKMTPAQVLQIASEYGFNDDYGLTNLEILAFAQRIRQEALEEAARFCDEGQATELLLMGKYDQTTEAKERLVHNYAAAEYRRTAIEIRNLMSKGE